MPTKKPVYKRVLVKLSGEALMGGQAFGIDPQMFQMMAREIQEVQALGVETSAVIGGGNIFRGMAPSARGMDRVSADHMGMLATVINALALQDALEKLGTHTRVLSAIEMRAVAEPFIRRRAIRHLEKGRVVIFAAGTGNPYFTTDTTAALRAAEIDADAILRGTHSGVKGIYTADPNLDPEAELLDRVSYIEVIQQGLQAMDATAITMCRDNDIPIVVFDLMERGNIRSILEGRQIGTIVTQ